MAFRYDTGGSGDLLITSGGVVVIPNAVSILQVSAQAASVATVASVSIGDGKTIPIVPGGAFSTDSFPWGDDCPPANLRVEFIEVSTFYVAWDDGKPGI